MIGSFRRPLSDDRLGGQGFACQSLIASSLGDSLEFIPIDSTIKSIRARSGWARLPAALARVVRAMWHLTIGHARAALCFASFGNSFIEKGLIVLLGSILNRQMILFPRSGHLIRQAEERRWFRWYMRLVLRRASVVVCQSASWREFYLSLAATGDRHKFVVVENWLAPDAFVAPDAPCSESRVEGIFQVGYMNRVESDKGVYDFIEAVRLAHTQTPAIRGIIYGDGSELEAVVERLKAPDIAGVITYGGWLDGEDKRERLRELDCYVFVSHVEGFPNSLLEVTALKVPVISVRVGAVVDVLADEQSALLADVGDVRTIADHLVRLAADEKLRHRLAEAAYDRVRERNMISSAVEQLSALLL